MDNASKLDTFLIINMIHSNSLRFNQYKLA